MDSVVEKVAKAVWEADWGETEDDWGVTLCYARAAIKATLLEMREWEFKISDTPRAESFARSLGITLEEDMEGNNAQDG